MAQAFISQRDMEVHNTETTEQTLSGRAVSPSETACVPHTKHKVSSERSVRSGAMSGSTCSDEGSKKKRRTTKDDICDLDEKWNRRFEHLEKNFDKMFNLISAQTRSSESDKENVDTDRVSSHQSHSDLECEDSLSIAPGQGEMSDFSRKIGVESHFSDTQSDSDSEERFSRSVKKGDKTLLKDLFGSDAEVNSSTKAEGIILDESQVSVLSNSWRCNRPDHLTAYKEEYRSCFPVQEESKELLQVPTMDSIIESLLINKYGTKASSTGRSKDRVTLYSSSYKAIEKLAFQGQTAARYGMVACVYQQQILGRLLPILSAENPNIDSAIQLVRDSFAISTKTLDQIGRSGAFHHLVRRKCAELDSGLSDLKAFTGQLNSLPLTSDGVFGKELENKLKDRADQTKRLKDLIPDFERPKSTGNFKRKSSYTPSESWSKKPRMDYTKTQPQRNESYKPPQQRRQPEATITKPLSNFRIPKTNRK